MTEQCSSHSSNIIPALNDNVFTLPSSSVQQPTGLTASSLSTSPKQTGRIQIGPRMRLDECMNSIAKVIRIPNLMEACVPRTLRRISATNMSKELMANILDDYADLFQTNFIIIPFNENTSIDFQHYNAFIGTPDANTGQSKYQHRVFVLFEFNRQIFAPIYVRRADNSEKVRFAENDLEDIAQKIRDFIIEWNRQKQQNSTSAISNIPINNGGTTEGADSCETNNNAAQFSLSSNRLAPGSKVIKNRLQVICEMFTMMGHQLDHIALKQNSTQELLNNFNRSSDEQKIEMVCNELMLVTEAIRMTATPGHEEVGVESSSMEPDNQRHFAAPIATASTIDTQIMSTQQNTLAHSKSSTNVKNRTTTADVQQLNAVLLKYAAPKISRQPTSHQRSRGLSALTSRDHPLIQGGGKDAPQQTHVETEVPGEDGNNLNVAVRAVTVQQGKHPLKIVVAQNPSMDISLLPEHEYAYLPISLEERKAGKKEILAHLINLSGSRTGMKGLVIAENLHLCKLEFRFCIRNADNESYQFVSPASYSSPIEEGDAPVNIVSTENDGNQEIQLCDQGREILEFPLTAKCLKRGLRIQWNEEGTNEKKFKIDQAHKTLLIMTPPKKSNNAEVRLTISRDEYDDETKTNKDRLLYGSDRFAYMSHNDLPVHSCGRESF